METKRGTLSRSSSVIGLAALVLCLIVLGAWAASADHVEPTFHADNPTCKNFNGSWTELKVEPVADGEYTNGTLTVTVAVDEDAKTFDWTSNIGVDAVFVKGGDNGNLYTYDPPAEETSDTGLHAPLNDSTSEEGDFYGLSHISFCYDVESPSPSPSETPSESPTPTVSPTETVTESPTPGVTVLPTTVQTSPSVLGTKVIANTGADVRDLILLALALILVGVVAFVTASRSAKTR
jgi:hypothetical protein